MSEAEKVCPFRMVGKNIRETEIEEINCIGNECTLFNEREEKCNLAVEE